MPPSQGLSELLKMSADGFIWAVRQVPSERLCLCPPPDSPLGTWTGMRHVFHMSYYEQKSALPFLRYCAGLPVGRYEADEEEEAWLSFQAGTDQSVEPLLLTFQQARMEQLALLPSFDQAGWEQRRSPVPVWGSVSVQWAVAKTYQHTCEHTHNVLSLALFWDRYLSGGDEL